MNKEGFRIGIFKLCKGFQKFEFLINSVFFTYSFYLFFSLFSLYLTTLHNYYFFSHCIFRTMRPTKTTVLLKSREPHTWINSVGVY